MVILKGVLGGSFLPRDAGKCHTMSKKRLNSVRCVRLSSVKRLDSEKGGNGGSGGRGGAAGEATSTLQLGLAHATGHALKFVFVVGHSAASVNVQYPFAATVSQVRP